jgi:uncharacterized membrane protein (DUF485 family)
VTTTDHDPGAVAYTPREAGYIAMQESAEFQELRKRYRGWVLPVAAAALVWYFAYVALAAYAPGFMGQRLVGNLNVGLLMGFLQFVSTFGITALYIRHADKSLDTAAAALCDRFEVDHQ